MNQFIQIALLVFGLLAQVSKADDQSILVDFYNGLYSHGTLDWDTGSDLCGQTGVVCDGSNRVTELNLAGYGLSSEIPPSLGDLSFLTILNLGNNQMTGSIPSELGNLAQLQVLDLRLNWMGQELPDELGLLTNLQELYLNNQAFSGPIPSSFQFLTSLTKLQLQDDLLEGDISDILGLPLTQLYLNGNKWNCPIPNYETISDNDYEIIQEQCDTKCPGGGCSSHGICQLQAEGYICYCNRGYTGDDCEDIEGALDCGEGVEVNGLCACPSGYLGDNCENYLGGSCSFPTSAPLSTQSLGELNVQNITNNNVEVMVSVPGTELKTVTSIFFGATVTPNDPVCEYPGPSFTKDFDDVSCEDTFTSSISIVDLIQNCGFEMDTGDTGSFQEYDGTLWITFVEHLGTFRGVDLTRTVSSSLNLILSLPAAVTVNGFISLFSVPESVFVLTDQAYDKGSDSAMVTITSILTYPFKFSTATFIGTSVFTIQDSTPLDETCDDNSGDCIQTTTFIIQDISTNGCTFSGDYEFQWTQVCRGSNCPSSLDPISATVSLESSNICSSIKVYSSISGSIESFNQQLIPETSFMVGDTIHFEVDFVSDVDVDHFLLVNLFIDYNSNPRYLFQNGVLTSLGDSNSFSALDDQFTFSVSVGTDDDEDLIISGSSDIAITFEVFAEYEIFYKTTFRKRSIQSQQLSLSKKISIVSSSNSNSKISSKTTQDIKQQQQKQPQHEMMKASSSTSIVSSFSLVLISLIFSFVVSHY